MLYSCEYEILWQGPSKLYKIRAVNFGSEIGSEIENLAKSCVVKGLLWHE